MTYEDGRIVKRRVSRGEARVFIERSHEGYIDMETYDENQRMIQKNRLLAGTAERVGPVRGGYALLAGILRCSRCGRKVYVEYSGKSGSQERTGGTVGSMGDKQSGSGIRKNQEGRKNSPRDWKIDN